MNKVVCRLGFLMTLLFILTILMSPAYAFTISQDSVGKEPSEDTTATVALQTEQSLSLPASPSPVIENAAVPSLPPNTLKHYLGSVVNTGIDNGYSELKTIEENDPHFGWTLGRFFVSGYTRVSEDANANPVFMKTLGDKVALWFTLEQDISNLNGNDKHIISEDTNGYDEYFGIEKTNFGHGTLIIRHTDYQNLTQKPTVYTNYLVANATTDAETQVELFEEGDYEVALDYEIKASNIFDYYTNYRIFFQFSVRNGNCMIYPFDVGTKAELTNSSITENGFYLDLAKSRYLDINIKKEVLTNGAKGLTEDIRFNRPAKDGDKYTEEGIYTITVNNRYTGQETTKQIYVGTNNILKAYITTGLSFNEIDEQLAHGALIRDDGVIVQPATYPIGSSQTNANLKSNSPESTGVNPQSEAGSSSLSPTVWTIIIIVISLIIFLIVVFRKRNLFKTNCSNNRDDEVQNVNTKAEDKSK